MAIGTPGREEALHVLEEAWRGLSERVARISEADLDLAGVGRDWSVKDIIGHVAAWEQAALDAIEDWQAGEAPRIDQVIPTHAEVDPFNASEVERRRPLSVGEVRAEARQVHHLLVESIAGLSDQAWVSPFEGARRPGSLGDVLGRILGAPALPFGHVFAHLPDLDAFLSRGS